ncbi:MAG TPA: phage tail protein [Nostocaceae cyanobacterium]|nr:phage tail protein [Nostocaceae cyanobacterium]
MSLPEILTNSKFYLELILEGSQEIDGYFMDCQGFNVKQDPIEIAEVTKGGVVVRTKIPGNVKVGNITLKRGLSISQTMWKWFENVQNKQWGQKRKDGFLVIYDQGAREAARYDFKRAWPTSYKIGDLKAAGNEFQIEELELVVEELIRTN